MDVRLRDQRAGGLGKCGVRQKVFGKEVRHLFIHRLVINVPESLVWHCFLLPFEINLILG